MALNKEFEKSALDESASIYAKRDESETERSRWSKMDRKQRWVHFKTYYLRLVIIGCFVLAVAGFFVYKDVIKRTEVIYRCAILNEIATDLPITSFADSFTQSLDLDPDRNMASFHLYYTNTELANRVGATVSSDLTNVSSMIYAGTLDSVIAGQEDFDGYREKGLFWDLTEWLSEEQREKLADKLYIPETEDNEQRHPYGIYLDQSAVYQQIFEGGGGIVEQPVLGFIVNSKTKEMSMALLDYLFPELGSGADS